MSASRPSYGPLAIRALIPADRHAWQTLWDGYLAFYEARVDPEVTDTTWKRFHDVDEPMYALGAFDGDRLLGIVHCVKHRATWTDGWYIYLEDLFTAPNARGKGVGRALIQAVYTLADAHGTARVYWHTHQNNESARKLYDAVGHNAGFVQYRRPV
ncbi:MAG: GNAT family N-acetyltransferase [Devosiaceae bacterium]